VYKGGRPPPAKNSRIEPMNPAKPTISVSLAPIGGWGEKTQTKNSRIGPLNHDRTGGLRLPLRHGVGERAGVRWLGFRPALYSSLVTYNFSLLV
jgi:hypothetical protein